jgi:carboxymethylenebutenolidase
MTVQQWREDGEALVGSAAGLQRRGVLRAALGSGFAAAALPVMAQTVVKTAADGLDAGEVTIPVGDFKMPAYRAVPQGKRGAPVILVISEIFGVHEYIADVCRRFAKLGYCAIAPELFIRQGDASAYGEIAKLVAEVISKVPDEQVMTDLDATVAWAETQGQDSSKLAITGFCWGGRITWLYAARQPRLKAAVAWYGRLEGASSPLTPRHPVELAGALKAPVLGLYGEKDTGISLDSVAKMKTALTQGSAAAKASEFVIYANAPHAFHADYRPSFQAEAAQQGWARCVAWLREHGAA